MKPVNIIATSFFFSAWGDRLWNFAVGLYLVKLTPGSLQLAAIYGLVLTTTAILFTPAVGEWIDRNNRLKTVRLLLLTTNVVTLLCALCILAYLFEVTSNEWLLDLMKVFIILLGSMANVTGVGEKISVSRDWIVVVCKMDKDLLASANALLRRIDLSAAVLAPVGVGLLMSVVSDLAGIVFICLWNILTMVAEYFLLMYVYGRNENLQHRAINIHSSIDEEVGMDTSGENATSDNDGAVSVSVRPYSQSTVGTLDIFRRFHNLLSAWKTYQRQSVVPAGVALSWLYLTVLGFNAITTSYAYSQHLKEIYISMGFAFGSLFGIGGTFLFPFLRGRLGLRRTGVVGGMLQLSMLSLCVVSIWLPGSPSSLVNNNPSTDNNGTIHFNRNTSWGPNGILSIQASPTRRVEYMSISFVILGIVLSRAGLWMVDLTVTQLQQENVPESERGAVGGAQYALNNVFDLLHYVLTICLPYPRQFWILILMSVGSVLTSCIIYLMFHIRSPVRGGYGEVE